MHAGHDEDDGRKPGDGERIDRAARPAEAPAAHLEPIQVAGDAIGVDRRDDPVEEHEDVEDLDEVEELDREPQELIDVRAEADAGAEGDEEDRPGGEPEGTRPGAGVGMAEAREDERQERCHERRATTRSWLLRLRHRRVG